MLQEEKSHTRICTSQSGMLLAACTAEGFNRKTICAFMQVGCAHLKVKSKGNIRIYFYFFLKAPFLLAYINQPWPHLALLSERHAEGILLCHLLSPPATKLRQGNVFKPVCHSVHRGVSVRETPLGQRPLSGQIPA